MSAATAVRLSQQVERAYREDAMQVAVVSSVLIAIGMALEAIGHLFQGPGFLVKVHGLLAMATGMLWWLLRRRRGETALAPWWAAGLWLICMLSVACHATSIGPGDHEMTRIVLSTLVVGTGALILPTIAGYLTLAASGIAAFLLFWWTAPAGLLLNVTVPLLVVSVAFLIQGARRRSVRHRVEGEALAEAFRDERDERLAADAATEMAVRLSAGFAHHFNNQLQEVRLGAEAADGMLGENHPAKPYVAAVVSSAQRAATLTAALMRFSRRSTLQRQRVRWQELADALTARLTVPAATRLTFAPSELQPYADFEQLLLCLCELLENALAAVPEDGGEIRVSLAEDGASLRISVQDNGGGFPPALIDQAAEPFVTSDSFEHFGLGLATAASIAARHGGALSIASEPGAGSTVSVTLPLEQDDD